MMTFSTDIGLEVDEIYDEMDEEDKKEMWVLLAKHFNGAQIDFDYDVANFAEKPAFEQKKILCNALGVSSYNNETELRNKLEEIITAS